MARLLARKARQDLYKNRPIIERTGFGDLLCYDEICDRWFRHDRRLVEKDINVFQEVYDQENFISVADLHDSIGTKNFARDHDDGWSKLIHGNIKIINLEYKPMGFMGMDEPVLVLSATIPPVKDYTD